MSPTLAALVFLCFPPRKLWSDRPHLEHTQVYRLCLIQRAPHSTRAAPETDLQGARSTESTVRRIQRLQFTWLSCHGDWRCATSQNAWASVVIFSGQEKASAGCLSRPYFGAWQGTVPFPMFCPASFCLHLSTCPEERQDQLPSGRCCHQSSLPQTLLGTEPSSCLARAALNTGSFFLNLGHWTRNQSWWKWSWYSQITEYYVIIKKSLEKLSNCMGKGL